MCKSILSHCENRLTNSVVDVLYQLPSMRRISLGKPSNYAHLICELASTTPSIVTCLVPKLQSMLTSDDVQVRSQYVALFGKILSIENSKLPMKFLLDSFLKRFLDIDAKIRLEAIAISGDIYHVQISSSADILEALQQRLYDIDDKVRKQVILILCNIFERNSDNFDGEIIVDMAKRMMDKSLSVRHAAITSISDLYNSLVSRSLSIRNSLKSIPVQILKLMQQESTATLAEQIFDEKILLGANIDLCARTNQLAFVYGSLEEDFRKFFVQKFIRDKKSISKEIFEVLEKPQESFEKVSPLLFKISLKLGLCISKEFNEVELTGLHKLLCHKDRKVRKWIETLGNVKADYEDQRTCQNEIRRLGRLDKSMQKVTEALSVRLPSFVFSAANIAELLELIRGLLEAGDRLGITIMLTLLKEFANEYKGVLDFFLLDLKALLKNASNDEIAGLILDVCLDLNSCVFIFLH